MEKFFHPYHIVNISPWPLLVGFGVLNMVIGIIKIFSYIEIDLLFISFVLILFISMIWWRDVIRERTYQGLHSRVVLRGLIVGIILFIVREVFFFISFFWAFFHSRLRPTIEVGHSWPPSGIFPFNLNIFLNYKLFSLNNVLIWQCIFIVILTILLVANSGIK